MFKNIMTKMSFCECSNLSPIFKIKNSNTFILYKWYGKNGRKGE